MGEKTGARVRASASASDDANLRPDWGARSLGRPDQGWAARGTRDRRMVAGWVSGGNIWARTERFGSSLRWRRNNGRRKSLRRAGHAPERDRCGQGERAERRGWVGGQPALQRARVRWRTNGTTAPLGFAFRGRRSGKRDHGPGWEREKRREAASWSRGESSERTDQKLTRRSGPLVRAAAADAEAVHSLASFHFSIASAQQPISSAEGEP
jgi:hypothetical protein